MQVIKNVRDYDTWVTLPCQVSNPQSKPYLFLDHEDSVSLYSHFLKCPTEFLHYRYYNELHICVNYLVFRHNVSNFLYRKEYKE